MIDLLPLADRVVALHERLAALGSLAPSPVVDALFDTLVTTCVTSPPDEGARALTDPRVHRVRPGLLHLCAEGEAQLEHAWARIAVSADDPAEAILGFPYLDNYTELVRLELHALGGAGHDRGRIRRICFVGGGPLPLSAVLLHRELGVPVTVVDRDPDAVGPARRLVHRLLPAAPIEVVRADATSAAELARAADGCDVIVVAALVGLDRTQKRQVLRAVADALAPGAFAVVRSADGLRTLLYPAVEVQDVRDAGLTPQVLVHPLGDVVNSVLVARRDGPQASPRP